MKKQAVLFRCPQCMGEIRVKKDTDGVNEITLETGEIFSLDDVELIEVSTKIRCANCGDMIKDIVFDESYGENPWILYVQDGDAEEREGGGKTRHMKIAERFENLSEAINAYNVRYKANDRAARINLRSEDQMIIIVEFEPDRDPTYPVTILKFRGPKGE